MSDGLVVIGCPVANRAWCLNDWWHGAAVQAPHWSAAFVYSDSEDDTYEILTEMAEAYDTEIMMAGPSTRTREAQDKHWWPEEHFEDMARWRNQLLDYADRLGAEWFFSVDSDIMLPAGAFRTLRDTLTPKLAEGYGAIAPIVNMAVHLDTFAYNYMQWNDQATGSAMRPDHTMPAEPFKVGVIMAAMLIHRSAFHVRWHSHPQGEDLGWSYDAREKGVQLLVDPRVACNHRMQRTA